MIAFKKSEDTRDLIFKDGKIELVNGIDVIKQNCGSVMRQQISELRFYSDRGIDFIDNVFDGTPNFQMFESQARNALLSVEGVTSVTSFDYFLSDNMLTYNAIVKTDKGSLKINESI